MPNLDAPILDALIDLCASVLDWVHTIALVMIFAYLYARRRYDQQIRDLVCPTCGIRRRHAADPPPPPPVKET